MIDSIHFSKALTERFGLEVSATAEQVPEGQKVVIRPTDIEHTISFQVELVLGWRTVSAVFKPGNFAATLVKSMNDATQEQKAAFSVFAHSLRSKGARVDLLVNNASADPTAPESWPDDWHNITIGMKKIGVILEKNSIYDFKEAFPWATGFFGMSLGLLPLEELPDEEMVGEAEGPHNFRRVKRYERSRINRAACIEIHGTSCNICGFSFGEVYGELGEGFIHIHHIVPVSEMGGKYILNPGKDLIPVCPNCHAMLHRGKAVLFPNDLKEILGMDI